MGILPELFNVRKVGPRGIVGDAISRVGVGGRQVRSRLAKSHTPALFPNEDFDAEEFVFGTKATDSPAHAEGQKFQGEGGNWFVIRDGHAIPTANPNAVPAPVPDQKKTELTPDLHAARQAVADIGAKLRDGETVSPADKEQFGEAFKTLTPDDQAKVADAIKPPATSFPNATPRRPKSDPGDWTIPDWEAAPGPRDSKKRWRNRYTGAIRYGDKQPKGRTEEQRKEDARIRANRLAKPAQIASGQWDDAEWDAATGKYVHGKSAEAAAKAEQELALTPENLTGLAGNMPGTRVKLRFNDKYGVSMSIQPEHPDVTDWSRRLQANKDGSLTLDNIIFFLRPSAQGSGFGTDAFANQVAGCVASGVSKIATCAGRGTLGGNVPMNGYSTWPTLGYDAPLDASQIKRLPPELKHAKTVQDLYETQAGKDWWKKHGECTSMTFDVSPNSRSLRVLNAYLAKNGKPQVAYSPEQHEENKAKQAKRAESLKTYGARSGFEPTHTQWADRARAAGFDAADIRRRAEARVTSSPNATPQGQQAALNTAYNDELNQRGRYRFVTALQEAGDDKGIMGAGPFVERAKSLGYSQRELFNRARTLGIRDSSVLQAQTARAAWINGLNLALDDLKTDRKSRLIQAMRDPAHRDLRDKYQAHVHSEIGDGQAFLNGLSSFGLNHAPALAESDPRRAAEEMFRATADAAITARRERLKREQEQAGAKT